jgi:DNA repair protein RadD
VTLPELRHYQRDVIDRAAARVKAGLRRGIIQGGTGAGKGHCVGYLAWRAQQKGSRVLIVADRRKLVGQLGSVLDAFGVRHGVIMAGRTGGTRENVIVACRDTFTGWLTGDRDLPPFDIVMPDECHLFPGERFQQIARRYPRAVTLGFSATPCRNDGKSMGDFFQFLECMAPPSQLIREGWLLKPEVYAPVELAGHRKKGTGKGLAGDPVSHWKRHADGLPTIAFAGRSGECDALKKRFLEAGVPAEDIDAGTPDDEREAKFHRLKTGRTMVLCSMRLLIQGVDIPEVACAIFWARFGSLIDWYQGNGRIMRPAPGKTRCISLDHAGAAGEHGLPGEDVEWSLDLASTVGARRDAAIEKDPAKATVVCRACGLAYQSAPACPNCGKAAPRVERKRSMAEQYEATTDAILERFDGDQARDLIRQKQQRMWVGHIRAAIKQGKKAGAAAAMFSKACKVAPWEAGVDYLPTERGCWQRDAAEVWPQFA